MALSGESGPPVGWRDAMDAFFRDHWGPIEEGLGERVSAKGIPSIDLIWHRIQHSETGLWVRTRGMSDLPMATPTTAGVPDRAELVMCIPRGWRFMNPDGSVDLDAWWLGAALKALAAYPHANRSWYSMGHTMTLSEDGVTPLDSTTLFTDVMLEFPVPPPPVRFEHDGVVCMFLQPVFLTAAEAARVRVDGLDALSSFGRSFDHWFNPTRSCAVTGQRPARS